MLMKKHHLPMVPILLSSWFPVPVQVHFDLVPDQIALVDIPGVHEVVPDSLLSYILDDVFLLYLIIQPEAPEIRGEDQHSPRCKVHRSGSDKLILVALYIKR